MRHPILVLVAALALAACSTTPSAGGDGPKTYPDAAEAAYQEAVRQLEGHDYPTAVRRFEEVKSKFPYSKFAALAELRIADALYQQDKFLEAADAYRTFVRLRPTHPEADYAAFREAEALSEHAPSNFFVMPPAYEKDLTHVREVIAALDRFLAEYPDSEYVGQARELRAETRSRLADHELYVADFYRRREKWRGVANRLETVLARFSDIGYAPRARVGLAEAWLHFDPPRVADARRLLQEVLADEGASPEVKAQARELLAEAPAADAPGPVAPTDAAPAPAGSGDADDAAADEGPADDAS